MKPLENLSSANQILRLVFSLPIERPPAQETSNTRIYSETSKHLMCFSVVAVNFHSKNTSNRTRIFAGKRQKSSSSLQIAFIRVLQGNLSSSHQFKYFSLKSAQV